MPDHAGNEITDTDMVKKGGRGWENLALLNALFPKEAPPASTASKLGSP
jgi:hypothetical protein